LTSDHAKHNTEKYDSIGDDKKERKTCVRIKRVKIDSYLTYGQSYKTCVSGHDTSSCDVTETDHVSWINNVYDSSQHRALLVMF
jgi:hypothetical protein